VFRAVSCPSRTLCFAVGYYATEVAGAPSSLIEAWNGRRWLVQSTPPEFSSELHAITCTSTTACMAVGFSGTGPLAETWDGKRWRAVSVPAPTTVDPHGATLDGVSCSSAAHCEAVGFGFAQVGVQLIHLGVAYGWNGTGWAEQQTPRPALVGSGLNAVSCVSANDCVAAGDLLDRWNGTSWTTELPPSDSIFSAVACPSTSTCITVGGPGFDERAGAGPSWDTQTAPPVSDTSF
jgi:hypothetical protein